MTTPKATITIDLDEDGRPRAVVQFDPPLPERPEEPNKEDEWLSQIPTVQLAAFIIMDNIMDMFGDDMELESTSVDDYHNGTKH